jgi:hypothetical protein
LAKVAGLSHDTIEMWRQEHQGGLRDPDFRSLRERNELLAPLVSSRRAIPHRRAGFLQTKTPTSLRRSAHEKTKRPWLGRFPIPQDTHGACPEGQQQ